MFIFAAPQPSLDPGAVSCWASPLAGHPASAPFSPPCSPSLPRMTKSGAGSCYWRLILLASQCLSWLRRWALAAFLAVTPFHDKMITIASTLGLVSMFYITVFVFKSRLHLMKILSIACLLASYVCNYIYFTRRHVEVLPISQKIALAITIVWILSL